MVQLTVRGMDEELEGRLRQVARREGISLNGAALRLLRCGAGLGTNKGSSDEIGVALDHFAGTMSADEERLILEAVEQFENVDDEAHG